MKHEISSADSEKNPLLKGEKSSSRFSSSGNPSDTVPNDSADKKRQTSSKKEKKSAHVNYKLSKLIKQFGLVSTTILLDGNEYILVGFSSLLSSAITIEALKVVFNHPQTLQNTYPLIILGGVHAINGIVLRTKFNSNYLDELNKNLETTKPKLRIFPYIKRNLQQYPVQLAMLLFAALANSSIIFTNFGYILNQYNIKFHQNDIYFYGGLAFSILAGIKFWLTKAPLIIKYSESEFSIEDDFITNLQTANFFKKNSFKFLVSALPFISALTATAFASSQTYSLAQYLSAQFEPEAFANKMAWLFTILLGLTYFSCHRVIVGTQFRNHLMNILISNFDDFKNNFLSFKNLAVNSLALYKSFIYGVIGFSAIAQMTFIAYYQEAPPVPVLPNIPTEEPIANLWLRVLAYAPPALIFAAENFFVEGRDVFYPVNNANKDKNKLSDGKLKISKKYTINEFFTDTFTFASILFTKYLISHIYLNDSDKEQVKLSNEMVNSLETAGLAFIICLLRTLHLYIKEHDELLIKLNTAKADLKKLENSLSAPANNDITVLNTSGNHTLAMDRKAVEKMAPVNDPDNLVNTAVRHPYTRMLMTLFSVFAVTLCVEMLFHHFVFDPDPSDEEQQQQSFNNSRIIGDIAGGFVAAGVMRKWPQISDSISVGISKIKGLFPAIPRQRTNSVENIHSSAINRNSR